MKKLILFTVVAAALAFVPGKAAASINLSGTAVFNYTNYIKGTNYIAKTVTMSLNNAWLYYWISNAVANATNGLATNLPAKGSIEYLPEGFDGKYTGFFYVADSKGGIIYQLSGLDTNGDYYSFLELNANDEWFGSLGDDGTNVPQHSLVEHPDDSSLASSVVARCCCGSGSNSLFSKVTLSAYMENLNEKTGFGKYSAIDNARIAFNYFPYLDDTNPPTPPIRWNLTGIVYPKLTIKYFYPYEPSSLDFYGYGHIDLIEGNLTEGFNRWGGIINSVAFKINP